MLRSIDKSWSVLMLDGGVHVIPDADLVQHDEHDCVCIPAVELVRNPDGSDGWLVTHHSLDGRERYE